MLFAWLHYPVALVLLWAALSAVYRYSPAVTLPWRSVILGAAIAVAAWAVTTVGFSFYLAKFADFGVTYGSLGAAVGLLVYLNLSASIVLAGAELNAALHTSAAGKIIEQKNLTLTGRPEKPEAEGRIRDDGLRCAAILLCCEQRPGLEEEG